MTIVQTQMKELLQKINISCFRYSAALRSKKHWPRSQKVGLQLIVLIYSLLSNPLRNAQNTFVTLFPGHERYLVYNDWKHFFFRTLI